jgi:hypothetical protein
VFPVFSTSDNGGGGRDCQCCQKIGLCLADTADKGGGDRSRSSAQDDPFPRRLDPRPDPGEVGKKIAGRAHIAVSAPGGTSASSTASGIGPIGPIGDIGPVSSGLLVL